VGDPDDAQVRASLTGRGQRVVFMGGEPTLRQQLPAWIQQARSAGAARVVLQTNGRRLAYRSYAASLAEQGLDAVDISLQGPRAEIHDHHTRCPGSHGQTVAGARAARRCGLTVGITCVVTRSNFRHLEALVRLAAKVGAARLHLALARPLGEALRLAPRVIPPPALVEPHLQAACARARAVGLDLVVSPPGPGPAPPPGVDGEDLFAGLGWTAAAPEREDG